MPRSLRAALALGVFVALAPTSASAYETKKTSSGAPLHWPIGPIALAMAYEPHPAAVDPDAATQATTAAIATWRAALDGTGLDLAASPSAAPAAPHDGSDGLDQIRWAIDPGDPDREPGVLALTFVSYRASDGEIRGADIVLDAVDFAWTTTMTGCRDEYDLESALAHELGHLLGLAHSIGHPDATMFATGDACEIGKRDLSEDDRSGIDALYRTSTNEPDADEATGGCAAGGSGAGSAFAILLGAIAFRRRRTAGGLVAAAILVTSAPAPAHAATLRRLELAELGATAVVIARGKVIATTPAADPSFATDATLVVDECLAGACPRAISIRRRGGERGDRGLWVDGEAQLAPGAEVVVFLRRDARGHHRVLGGIQGAFHVIDGHAVRDLRGQRVLDRGTWQDGTVERVELAALGRAISIARRGS